jgi:hypothetical protein
LLLLLSLLSLLFQLQDCVNKTIARIKSKLEREDKRVLNHVVYGLRSTRR